MKILGFYNNYNTLHNNFKGGKKAINTNKPIIATDPYDEYKLVYEYSKPVTLKKALFDITNEKKLGSGIIGEKEVISRFIKDLESDKKILRKKVIRLAGYGSTAAVFETPQGKIIKITDGNHFPLNRPHETFDVPIFKKGNVGKTYYYVEEKTYQHNIPVGFVEEIKNHIRQKGYKPFDIGDFDTFQIGLSKKGELYLLDPECAEYKTIFHAVFSKVKQAIKKRMF